MAERIPPPMRDTSKRKRIPCWSRQGGSVPEGGILFQAIERRDHLPPHQDAGSQSRVVTARDGHQSRHVNLCLKGLVEKGLLEVCDFCNSDSNLQHAYVVTPKGLSEKAENHILGFRG